MRELILTPVQLAELSQDLLKGGARVRFEAHGQSMHPFLQDGDIITVEAAREDDMQIGEIALFRRDLALVAHRVVGMERGEGDVLLYARGDASLGRAELIPKGGLIGKVVLSERGTTAFQPGEGWGRALAMVWETLLPMRALLRGLARRLERLPQRSR